jgi:Permease family
MAYIVVGNPLILSQAGMPTEGVVFATCLSAAMATLVMGLYANYPIALAPGMSLKSRFQTKLVPPATFSLHRSGDQNPQLAECLGAERHCDGIHGEGRIFDGYCLERKYPSQWMFPPPPPQRTHDLSDY